MILSVETDALWQLIVCAAHYQGCQTASYPLPHRELLWRDWYDLITKNMFPLGIPSFFIDKVDALISQYCPSAIG